MTVEILPGDEREVTEAELRSTFAEYVSLDPWPTELGTPIRKIVSSPFPSLVPEKYMEMAVDRSTKRFVAVTGSPLPEDPTERAETLARIRYPRPEEGTVELQPGQWRVAVQFPRTRVVLVASGQDEHEFELLRSRLTVMNAPPS